MKQIITLTFSFLTLLTFAQNVKLKVTYNGQGVSGHFVTAFIQGAKRGTGVTDKNGEVTINIQGLNSQYLDWKGEKKCDDGEKKWEVKGYGKLDENNFYHLKMEDFVAMMVEASGGFMSSTMIVASYGLVCNGTPGNGSSSNESSSSKENGSGLVDTKQEMKDSQDAWSEKREKEQEESSARHKQTMADLQSGKTREEGLQNQKTALDNAINSIDREIQLKEDRISKKKVTGKEAEIERLEIEELLLKKQIKQLNLDKNAIQMQNGMLNKTERRDFKEREEELDSKISAKKEEIKTVKKAPKNSSYESSTATVKTDKEDHLLTLEDITLMSTQDLKLRRVRISPVITSNNLKLKLKSKKMSEVDKEELKSKTTQLSKILNYIDTELKNRD